MLIASDLDNKHINRSKDNKFKIKNDKFVKPWISN